MNKIEGILREYLTTRTSVAGIAKKNCISEKDVVKILKLYGLTSRNKKKDVPVKVFLETALLKTDRYDILEKYDLTPGMLKKYIKEGKNQCAVAEYKAGVKVEVICKRYGISNMTLYSILDKAGIPRKVIIKKDYSKNKDITEEQEGNIVSDYVSRMMTVNEILEKYHITKNYLYDLLYSHGVLFRNKSSIEEAIKENIIKDFKEGKLSKTQISEKYGMSRSIIKRIVELNGDVLWKNTVN